MFNKTLDKLNGLVYNIGVRLIKNLAKILKRQVKEMDEMQDKTLERVIEYLTAKGWTDSEILDLLRYLAKT